MAAETAAADLPGAVDGGGFAVSTFRVAELDCAAEENELRAVLAALPGVRSLEFDLVARRVRVRHNLPGPGPLETAIRGLGMRPELLDAGAVASPSLPRRTIAIAIVAGALAVGSELAVIAGADEQSVIVAGLAIAAVAVGGRDTLRKAVQAIRARRLTMSLLMTVAVLGAAAIGQWPEAAVVILQPEPTRALIDGEVSVNDRQSPGLQRGGGHREHKLSGSAPPTAPTRRSRAVRRPARSPQETKGTR